MHTTTAPPGPDLGGPSRISVRSASGGHDQSFAAIFRTSKLTLAVLSFC